LKKNGRHTGVKKNQARACGMHEPGGVFVFHWSLGFGEMCNIRTEIAPEGRGCVKNPVRDYGASASRHATAEVAIVSCFHLTAKMAVFCDLPPLKNARAS
jgi:hypothetical protein